jgi:hypothetical protein
LNITITTVLSICQVICNWPLQGVSGKRHAAEEELELELELEVKVEVEKDVITGRTEEDAEEEEDEDDVKREEA